MISLAPGARAFAAAFPLLPVPLRGRHDGWTPQRQGDFIGFLAETASVAKASREVGMSRQSAYELRARPEAEGFAAAWDTALGLPIRKVTEIDLSRLAFEKTVRPIMRAGRYRGSVHKASSSALLTFLDRLDRAALRRIDMAGL